MWKRAVVCLDTELADLPRESDGAAAGERLRIEIPIIERESAAQTAQGGTAKQGTAQRRVARNRIREILNALAKTADTIARRKPGFDEQFPMPYGSRNDEQLLALARATQIKAAENREDFERLGITREFMDSIAPEIEAFADALETTSAAVGSRGAAVSGIDESTKRGADDFEDLNTFVRNFYRDRPEKLAAWRIATHVERAPVRKKKDEAKG